VAAHRPSTSSLPVSSTFLDQLPVPLRPVSALLLLLLLGSFLHHFRFISCAIFLYLCSRVFAPCSHILNGLSLASLSRPLLVFPLGFPPLHFPPPFTAHSFAVAAVLYTRTYRAAASASVGLLAQFCFPFSISTSISPARLQLLLPISLLQIIYIARVCVGTLVNSLACFMALLGVRLP